MSWLRVGIVGCGKIAGNHARAFQQVPETTVVACCDTNPGRARAFGAQHRIAAALASVEEMLALDLDVVSVCTPHPVHEEVVLAAAASGRHVLCEKPVAVDLAAADRMIAATERAGVSFGVMFQRRFWPAAQRVKAAIDDGRIGRPVLGEVSVVLHRPSSYYAIDAWRGRWDTDGGGVLMTQAIHQIDMLCWLMGEPVWAFGQIRTHTHAANIETEDTASAMIGFASGATATLTATTGAALNLGNRVNVMGETGAQASVLEFPEGAEGINDVWTVPGAVEFNTRWSVDARANLDIAEVNAGLAEFHSRQIQDFAEAVRTGRLPAVTGRDAYTSLAVVLAVYESARTGRAVDIAPPRLSPVGQGDVSGRAPA